MRPISSGKDTFIGTREQGLYYLAVLFRVHQADIISFYHSLESWAT